MHVICTSPLSLLVCTCLHLAKLHSVLTQPAPPYRAVCHGEPREILKSRIHRCCNLHLWALPRSRMDQPSVLCRAVVHSGSSRRLEKPRSLVMGLPVSPGCILFCVRSVCLSWQIWALCRCSLHPPAGSGSMYTQPVSLCRVLSCGDTALISLGSLLLHGHHLHLLGEPGSI